MIVLIKLFYALAIACLLVLVVAFGVRTAYGPPSAPEYPQPPASIRAIPSPSTSPETQAELTRYDEEQRRYQAEYERYSERRADYRRNVFVIVAAFGIAAVAAGLSLPTRLDAVRLGLVLGGLATILYGVIQAGGDLDEAGPALVFVVAAIGLGLILFAGYRWLGRLEEPPRAA